MITSHESNYNISLTAQEAKEIILEINLVYDKLLEENFHPEGIVNLLTLKNAIVVEMEALKSETL